MLAESEMEFAVCTNGAVNKDAGMTRPIFVLKYIMIDSPAYTS